MKRTGCILAAAAFSFGLSTGVAFAFDPPPWCELVKNKNAAENAICTTASLADLDNIMNLTYAFAVDPLPAAQKPILKASQADWLKQTRNGCGADHACLARVMKIRTATLDDIHARMHF